MTEENWNKLKNCAKDACMSKRQTLITSAETGRILNVCPATLCRWRKEGRGPSCYRVGGVYRYDLAEVQSYLQSGRLDAETTPASQVPEK